MIVFKYNKRGSRKCKTKKGIKKEIISYFLNKAKNLIQKAHCEIPVVYIRAVNRFTVSPKWIDSLRLTRVYIFAFC
jgi:hypothetical protein